jgi:hypothetical protein
VAQHLFPATNDFREEYTRMMQFAGGAAGAIWNLRWQVAGYTAVSPRATKAELAGRFLAGSGVEGVDLRRVCLDTPWDEQLRELAKLLLLNICSYYEGWADGVAAHFSSPKTRAKELQFPPIRGPHVSPRGITDAIATMSAHPSGPMAASYGYLQGQRRFSGPQLAALLEVYRVFKEARNCVVHENGRASQLLVDVAANAAQLNASDLGMKAVPEYATPVLGKPYEVTYRGVIGLCDLVLRVVATVDAILATTDEGGSIVTGRWRDSHGRRMLTADPVKRRSTVRTFLDAMGFPRPTPADGLIALLRSEGLLI